MRTFFISMARLLYACTLDMLAYNSTAIKLFLFEIEQEMGLILGRKDIHQAWTSALWTKKQEESPKRYLWQIYRIRYAYHNPCHFTFNENDCTGYMQMIRPGRRLLWHFSWQAWSVAVEKDNTPLSYIYQEYAVSPIPFSVRSPIMARLLLWPLGYFRPFELEPSNWTCAVVLRDHVKVIWPKFATLASWVRPLCELV